MQVKQAEMLSWLNTVLFHLGGDSVTWAELLGFITGGTCVWMTVLRRVENFPIGIANSAFFLALFISARLWADSALQVLYIVLGFIGWWQWVQSKGNHPELEVAYSSRSLRIGCVGFIIGATALLTLILGIAHDAAPFWDALTTSISLAAQWMLNYKKLENWLFWIAADLIYIPLYFWRGLELTALIYLVFLGLCLIGLRSWLHALPKVSPPVEPVSA